MLDAAPPPGAPARAEQPEALSDLDALEHDLSRNEERLNQYLASREGEQEAIALRDDSESKQAQKRKGSATSGGAGYAQPPPASAPKPARKRAEERPADAEGAAPASPAGGPEAKTESVANACQLACRAFGSMQRSADRICAIAGESDERCRRARERVGAASARISSARCACQDDD